ncbi:MAG: DALR anticodon-binding domain-containing protein, partial [Patescibacteria group bacterium]
SEMVGIGAIKYFDLSHHPSSDIIFEWEKMFVLEGNSAPYLQYTFARTQSVLLKAKLKVSRIKYQELRINEEEMAVLRSLPKFSEVIEQAAQNYSPNLLCNYLFDLAQKYNNFYARHRILDTSVERTKSEALSDNPHRILSDKRQGIDDKTSEFRIALTAGVGQILKNGLNLLGIQAPKRM